MWQHTKLYGQVVYSKIIHSTIHKCYTLNYIRLSQFHKLFKNIHTRRIPIQLIQEAGMQHLSDALLDFLDEIHPHITNSKDQDTKDTFTDAESVVVTALNEAVTWEHPSSIKGSFIRYVKLLRTSTHKHSIMCVYQQWKLSFVDTVYFCPVTYMSRYAI